MKIKSKIRLLLQKIKIKIALFQRKEFAQAFDMDIAVISTMNRRETEEYVIWLSGERNKIHKLTL